MIALDYWRAGEFDGSPVWTLPAGASHALDLRRIPDQATTAPPRPSLFWFPGGAPRSARPLAAGLTDSLASADRDALAAAAGVERWTSTPDTINRAVRMILGDRVSLDPDQTPRPLTPTTDGDLLLQLGPQRTRERFVWNVHEQTGIVRGVLRDRTEAAWKSLASPADHDQLRRQVDYQAAKFETDWRELVKPHVRIDLAPLPHATTIADTFTAANGTNLYAHTGGGFVWTEVRALPVDPAIQSNRVAAVGGGSTHYVRAEVALSGDDMLAECLNCIVESSANAAVAPCVRFSNASFATVSHYMFYRNGAGANTLLFKRVNGAGTVLATTTLGGGSGERLGCRIDGSQLRGLRNLAPLLEATDTSVAGYFKAGFGCSANVTGSTSIDDWQAEDLLTATPWVFYHSLRRTRR